MLYLIVFLAILFGLSLIFLFIKIRSEGNLKSQLRQTSQKLEDSEMLLAQMKQAEVARSEAASGQQLRSILDSLLAGVVVVNQSGKIEFLNRRARALLNFTDDNIGNEYKTLPLVSLQISAIWQAIMDAGGGKSTAFGDGVSVKVGSKVVPMTMNISPFADRDGKPAGALLMLADATTIEMVKTGLQSSFSAFAHELRTPIAIIKTGVALVLEHFETLGPEKTKETLTSAYAATGELADLVTEVLNASRLEQGKVNVTKENFDLVALSKQVVTSLTPMAREKKLFLNHEAEVLINSKVTADRNKTLEILTNLISNAIKYTYQGGVTVTHQTENSHIATIVKDTGMGITPEQKRLLFQKFQQVGVSRTMGTSKSTGLGLYIAKQLALAMGGDVVLLTSEPNQGSEFKLTLPVSPS